MGVFYTAQFGHEGTDITWRARHLFSPTKALVHAFKFGGISWEEYCIRYREQMREAYRRNPGGFIVADGSTFKCYCSSRGPCHRFLLAEILVKCGNEYGGEL